MLTTWLSNSLWKLKIPHLFKGRNPHSAPHPLPSSTFCCWCCVFFNVFFGLFVYWYEHSVLGGNKQEISNTVAEVTSSCSVEFCHFSFLNTFWCHMWSTTTKTHGNMEHWIFFQWYHICFCWWNKAFFQKELLHNSYYFFLISIVQILKSILR